MTSSEIDWKWLTDFGKGMMKPLAATAVVAVAVALSYFQKLGLEVDMAYSVFRAFLQLSVIGFVLQFIFTQEKVIWILLAYLFMVTVAGYTAGQRAKHVPRGKYVAGASILVGTAVTMFLLVLLDVFPFTPRYIIPVAGMMVGNAMTVTGVTMKRLRDDIKVQLILSIVIFRCVIGDLEAGGGNSVGTGSDATSGDTRASEEGAGDSTVAGAGQCEDGGTDFATGSDDGANNGRSFTVGGDPAADCGYEYAHRSVNGQQHHVHLYVLAGFLHRRLSVGNHCFCLRLKLTLQPPLA
ncbi:Protein ALUMINUM SENSITIVE 3 [Linum grandiflorum]